MIKKAQEKAKSKGIDVDLFKCDFRKLGNKNIKKYDCVLST